MNNEQRNIYRETGLRMLSEGKIALVLLAGGQATRLQMSAVKGNVDFGLPSRKFSFSPIINRSFPFQTTYVSYPSCRKGSGGVFGKAYSYSNLYHDLSGESSRDRR